MQATNTAIILAAGNGSRMKDVSGNLPKPLVPVNGRPLLEHIILASQFAGIERFVIVLGYGSEAIEQWLGVRHFPGAHVELVRNTDYGKANGISALKARDLVGERFLLLMADHLFDDQIASDLLELPVDGDATVLAVDRKLNSLFDIDDATKVATNGIYITDIGKQLSRYDAVDTGMFLCSRSLFSALELSVVDGDCSLSDGMRILAANRKLLAFDVGEALWQDVDTPEALEYATYLLFDRFRRDSVPKGIAHV
jgi:choline kinase